MCTCPLLCIDFHVYGAEPIGIRVEDVTPEVHKVMRINERGGRLPKSFVMRYLLNAFVHNLRGNAPGTVVSIRFCGTI